MVTATATPAAADMIPLASLVGKGPVWVYFKSSGAVFHLFSFQANIEKIGEDYLSLLVHKNEHDNSAMAVVEADTICEVLCNKDAEIYYLIKL